MHIPTISIAKSVDLIRKAKQRKLNVTCSVAIHNLIFTDETLKGFNTNFKVLPPLRTQPDIDALFRGITDGTIDMITSDHNPINIEHKKVEFDYASYGTIGLESAFGVLHNKFSLQKTIKLLTQGKAVFNITATPIAIGNKVNITLFNPKANYQFTDADMISKSKNSIFKNSILKGKVFGIISNNQTVLN